MLSLKTVLMIVIPIFVITAVGAAGYSKGRASERAVWQKKVTEAETRRIQKYEQDLSEFKQQVSLDATRSTNLTNQLLELRAERDRLAAARVPLVRIKEVPVNVQGKCSISVLSGAFGVCFAAAATGDASAAGACQAAGSDAGTAGSTSF